MTRRKHNPKRAIASRTVPGSLGIAMKMAQCRAKKKNIEFDLDVTFLVNVFMSQSGRCAITGRDLGLARGGEAEDGNLVTIDRIDSSRGYTRDNVQLVTLDANRAKHALDSASFQTLCGDVIEKRQSTRRIT